MMKPSKSNVRMYTDFVSYQIHAICYLRKETRLFRMFSQWIPTRNRVGRHCCLRTIIHIEWAVNRGLEKITLNKSR